MKSLYCDVCKKQITAPVKGHNYYHIREYDICEPCKDSLDARLKPIVKAHFPYSAEWYEGQVMSLLSKGKQTNRI